MKFLIVLACLLAIAYANEESSVLKSDSEVNPDSFEYIYELSNGAKADQKGTLQGKDVWSVVGSYEYTAPNGKVVKVTYVADEHGYQPKVLN